MREPKTQSDSVAKLSQSNGSNFFSSGLRQKVDQLMNVLWAGGVNNPMDSIEQLSYLILSCVCFPSATNKPPTSRKATSESSPVHGRVMRGVTSSP